MKRFISLLLISVLLLGMGSIGVSASSDDDGGDTCFRGVFYYRPAMGEFSSIDDNVDYYVYSDDYFRHSAYDYDPHLASMSMAVAEASASSSREPHTPEGYAAMSRNVCAILDDIGFGDIEVNDDYKSKPTRDSIGAASAHKSIVQGGETFTLLAIIPRSVGYEAEWGNNFLLGAEGNAEGFDGSAEDVLAFARDYISEHEITGRVKVWTVGYSRGAGVSNLLAKKLVDFPEKYMGGASLSPEDLYAYSFDGPSAADVGASPSDPKYRGIFCLDTDADIVSIMAPVGMGFARCGDEILINNEDDRERMLQLLQICSPDLYDDYAGGMSSDHFKPKKLSFSNGSVELVDDDDSYIPSDVSEFLRGLSKYMTFFAGGREGYVSKYEQTLCDLLAYVLALPDDQLKVFLQSATENEDVLSAAVSMYMYFMKLEEKPYSEASASDTSDLAGTSAEAEAETGIDAVSIAKLTALITKYLFRSPESILNEAAGYFGAIITDAMRECGASDEQIDYIVSSDNMKTAVDMMSHLMFGNIWQSGEYCPLVINNEQMKNAATLIGNFMQLMLEHFNEVLISWIRVGDSYYDDYAPMTDAQLAGYRRVYIDMSGNSYSGEIYDSSGETVAQISDGRLVNSSDAWVGYTVTDDGGFLRIPVGEDYRIVVHADKASKLSVDIDEYGSYDAKATDVFDASEDMAGDSAVTIILPALSGEYSMPSGAAYAVEDGDRHKACILGDVDGDGFVTVIDATYIQRRLAGLPNISFNEAASDADEDGGLSITDATAIQRHLAALPTNENIGKTIYSA